MSDPSLDQCSVPEYKSISLTDTDPGTFQSVHPKILWNIFLFLLSFGRSVEIGGHSEKFIGLPRRISIASAMKTCRLCCRNQDIN